MGRMLLAGAPAFFTDDARCSKTHVRSHDRCTRTCTITNNDHRADAYGRCWRLAKSWPDVHCPGALRIRARLPTGAGFRTSAAYEFSELVI
jgi:hypothetical protein